MRLALRIVLVVIFGAGYWFTLDGPPALLVEIPHRRTIDAIIGTLFWLALAWLVTEILRLFVAYRARRDGLETQLPRLLFDIGGIVIFFCAGLIIVSQVFGLALSGLLVTSGIIAAAAGFALQPTATDLISGISLNFREGTMKLGDWIQIAGGVTGKVVQITWADTHLQTLDDRTVVIRNSRLIEQQMMNFNAPTRPFQNRLRIVVGYEAPPDRVAAILETAMRAVPQIPAEPKSYKPYVVIEELTENGVAYALYYYCTDYPDLQFVTHAVSVNALKFLDQAGFAPAYAKREFYNGRAPRAERGIERRINIAAILRRVPLFDSFGAPEIDELARGLALQPAKPGAVIVTEGDPGASLFIVVSGLLDVMKRTESGEARKVALLAPGQVFGEWSLLTGAARSATVIAAADTGLLEITKQELEPILSRHPEF
ncbi:MAG: cyclic nucleotide-binding domain-containing protein, partial [Stellaceae bacterium]